MAKKLYDTNIGKIQPQNIELEKFILGSIIYKPECYDLVSALLRPEHFYNENHGIIYKAISSLVTQAKPIDYLTLA